LKDLVKEDYKNNTMKRGGKIWFGSEKLAID